MTDDRETKETIAALVPESRREYEVEYDDERDEDGDSLKEATGVSLVGTNEPIEHALILIALVEGIPEALRDRFDAGRLTRDRWFPSRAIAAKVLMGVNLRNGARQPVTTEANPG